MMLLGTQRVNESGNLEIGGVDATRLAAEFGTPLYVMDEAALRSRCREYLTAFRARYSRVEVSLAGKAFMCAGICPLIEEEGLNLDVASGGELFTALRGGFPVERITFHGNNKSEEELRMALEARVGHVVVDNFSEIDRLTELASGLRRRQPVLLRVAPGIDPHTHRRISTGQVDSKFGFSAGDGSVITAVRRVREIRGLDLRGIHCHVGSQLLDTECHEASIAVMVDVLAQIHRETGLELEELNVGGGLGARYLEEHRPPTVDEFAEVTTRVLKERLEATGLKPPILALEPGRSLVAEAGTTLYTIGAVNVIPGVRTYVAVDGGLSDNPRPSMYDARYSVLVANRADREPDRTVTVSGKHCETDTLFPDVRLADPQPGDVLAVQTTGAYNFTMASNYNRLPRPAVVLVNEGRAELLVRRETYEDMVARDLVPPRRR